MTLQKWGKLEKVIARKLTDDSFTKGNDNLCQMIQKGQMKEERNVARKCTTRDGSNCSSKLERQTFHGTLHANDEG